MAKIIVFQPQQNLKSLPLPSGKAKITAFPVPASPLIIPAPVAKKVKRSTSSEEEQKKSLLAKIHIAKAELCTKLLGFDDASYRAILENNYNASSSKDLSVKQLENLVRYLSALGWQEKKGRFRRHKPQHEYLMELMNKIEALLAEKGRHEGRELSWDYATGILNKQTKGQVTSLDKASSKQLNAVVYALICDAKRKGRYHEEYHKIVMGR